MAKNVKYRQPLYEADRTHLHHRFLNIGFSQARAVAYMYLVRAPRRRGTSDSFPAAENGARLDALERLDCRHAGPSPRYASLYIAYLLEKIVKLANPRIRRREQARAASAARLSPR